MLTIQDDRRQLLQSVRRIIFNWWPALLLVVLIVGLAAPFWNVPLNRDQGVYATCADLLRRGGIPYESCWDTKGPLLHITYLVSFSLLGPSGRSPYIFNAVTIALTGFVLASITNYFLSGSLTLPTSGDLKANPQRWLPYGVGLLYGVMAVAVRYDMNAQPEAFANFYALLGIAAILTYISGHRRLYWLILAGILLTVAVLFKYALMLPFGVLALAVIFLTPSPERKRERRLVVFGVVLATSIVVVGLGLLLLFALGALDTALTHIYFLFRYFPRAQLNPDEFALRSQPVAQTLQYVGRVSVLYLLAVIGVAWAAVRRHWAALPVALYLIAAVALVWIQQRFTPYHWTAALPAVALGVGLFVNEVLNTDLSLTNKRIMIGLASLSLTINAVWFFYVDQWQIVGPFLSGQMTAEEFHSGQGTWDQIQVAEYLKERTTEDDGLWVWGHHTPIYHLAERYPPTRFIYNEPLLMRIRGGHPYREVWRAQALAAIYDDPPEYILLTTFDRTFFDFQNPNVSWAEIDAYNTFTERYYNRELTIGRFEVYRLKPYYSRLLDPTLLDAVTQIDLIEQFPDAEVVNQVEPEIDIQSFTVFPEAGYDTILMHSGGALTYILNLPDSPVCLRFDATMFPDSWEWGVDGASFAVDVAPIDTEETERVYARYISNAPEDQRWFEEIVDLSTWSGETIQLTFSTGPGPNNDFTGDWAGWGQPRIVTPPDGAACNADAVYDLR